MKKRIVSDEPIKSQQEADEARQYIIRETAATLNIPVAEATRRVNALFKSGILNIVDPSTTDGQMRIDAFMSIPSSTYAHLI